MKTEHSIMKQIPFLGLMVALSLVLSLYTGCSSKKGSISPDAAADEAGADGLEGALGDKDIVDGGRDHWYRHRDHVPQHFGFFPSPEA